MGFCSWPASVMCVIHFALRLAGPGPQFSFPPGIQIVLTDNIARLLMWNDDTFRRIMFFVCFHLSLFSDVILRLPTGWTVGGSNPGEGEIFLTCRDRLGGPTRLLYNGYRVFPGGKVRPGRDADPSPPSSADVKNRVELYLYSP